jgi:rubrerythrin
MPKKFKRTTEDFICEKCGTKVKGTGYTDHCPNCLWSKHVDINPGDRANECGGMMRPITVETKKDSYVITYQCEKCGRIHRVKSDKADDFDAILEIAKSKTSALYK